MKAIATLTLLAVISGTLLAGAHLVTKDRIVLNQKQSEAKVLAGLVETTDPTVLDVQGIELLTIEANGYGGTMQMVIAYRNKEVLGVRVLSHQETPGFSDVLRPFDWIGSFSDVRVDELDAVTGATITTHAVRRAVKDAIRNQEEPPL